MAHKWQAVSSVSFLDTSTGWALLNCADRHSEKMDDTCFEVAATTDAGANWSVVHPKVVDPDPESGFSGRTYLGFADQTHGWMVLQINKSVGLSSGVMLRTEDGGKTWIRLPAPPIADHFYFVTAKDGWLAGGPEGELYVTHDAGATWRRVELKSPRQISTGLSPVYDLPTFIDDKRGFLPATYESSTSSGTPVVLFRTEDGGKTWQPTLRTPALLDTHPWAPFPSAVVDGELLTATVSSNRVNLLRTGRGAEPKTQSAGLPVHAPSADQLSFISPERGWLLAGYWLLSTSDGGVSWTDVTPTGTVPALASSAGTWSKNPIHPEVASFPAADLGSFPASGSSVSTHLGFDTFPTPPTSTMQTWWNSSPYYDVSIYLYGSPNKSTNKINYPTTQWLSTVEGYGWGVIPIWFGLQSSCVTNQPVITQFFGPTTADASTQGAQQADLAVAADKALGITGWHHIYRHRKLHRE